MQVNTDINIDVFKWVAHFVGDSDLVERSMLLTIRCAAVIYEEADEP